jgi:hypothetical protein
LLLTQPTAALRVVVGDQDIPPTWVVQLLGARTLGQGAAELIRPRRDVLAIGVAVDLAHAASMLAAVRMWPRYRRAALTSGSCAAASAVFGALLTGIVR